MKYKISKSYKNQPQEKTNKLQLSVACGIGIVVGAIAICLLILAGGTSQFLTDQECNNLTIQSFQYGYTNAVYDIANYTTLTGNFTYLSGGNVQVEAIEDYCYVMIPNLNEIGGKKTWQQ